MTDQNRSVEDRVHEPGEPARDDGDDARSRPDDRHTPLFEQADADGYRTRWRAIQTGFVDEPKRAVAEADGLVTEVIDRLSSAFAGERRGLEAQWSRNERVSTEELRVAMQRYRSFFERLLST
jgi:hypothetical protein